MNDPFWFWKLDLFDKIKFILFVTVGSFVIGFINDSDIAKQTKLLKQELLQNCSTNNHCKETVKNHFQECFDENWDENGLGLYTRFSPYEFTECMNNNAGFEYFEPIWLGNL